MILSGIGKNEVYPSVHSEENNDPKTLPFKPELSWEGLHVTDVRQAVGLQLCGSISCPLGHLMEMIFEPQMLRQYLSSEIPFNDAINEELNASRKNPGWALLWSIQEQCYECNTNINIV